MIHRHFTASDTVEDLIAEDYNIIPLLSRFSIPLGFGDKSIAEVCDEVRIDPEIFLLIVNFTITGRFEAARPAHALGIVDFLRNSHSYFLLYKLPHIRTNLLAALDAHHSDINPAIMQFFDDYVDHVKKHFAYEERNVFPYITALASDKKTSPDYSIERFRVHHDRIAEKLSELKNIILRYYTTSVPNLMYDVLVDLFTAETDLQSHNDIENLILIPLARGMEESISGT
ncbi:MAG: hemerythrin domain-containing protein [Bacteroides sp.]|nr:hemerythrin domain-containing protein [Bacteroides sp.]